MGPSFCTNGNSTKWESTDADPSAISNITLEMECLHSYEIILPTFSLNKKNNNILLFIILKWTKNVYYINIPFLNFFKMKRKQLSTLNKEPSENKMYYRTAKQSLIHITAVNQNEGKNFSFSWKIHLLYIFKIWEKLVSSQCLMSFIRHS